MLAVVVPSSAHHRAQQAHRRDELVPVDKGFGEQVLDRLAPHEDHFGAHLVGKLVNVLPVGVRQADTRDTRTVGASTFSDAAHGEDGAAQRVRRSLPYPSARAAPVSGETRATSVVMPTDSSSYDRACGEVYVDVGARKRGGGGGGGGGDGAAALLLLLPLLPVPQIGASAASATSATSDVGGVPRAGAMPSSCACERIHVRAVRTLTSLPSCR